MDYKELQKSEDERIRKVLVGFFKSYKEQGTCGAETFNGIPTDDILAWLEKQGKQKPKWTEEDVIRLDRICKKLWKNRKGDTDEIYQQEQDVNWLKSLKERYTWKPSDEQIKAIRLARSFVVDDFGEHPTLSEILMELEEQLQKIKEKQQ